MKSDFEKSLLESSDIMKKTYARLCASAGKVIALITATVACLVTFTDINLSDMGARSFTLTLLMMLAASYIMYFSLEDAGERLGEESESYRAAKALYDREAESTDGSDLPALRLFCSDYVKDELRARREKVMFSYGYSYRDYETAAGDGKAGDKKLRRAVRRAARQTPLRLTPGALLSCGWKSRGAEIWDPSQTKFLRLIIRLIPSTLCMTLTVSVVLSAKPDLDAATVIDSILKLSALPVIGFRGYARGYNYSRCDVAEWLRAKARLLSAFSAKREHYRILAEAKE